MFVKERATPSMESVHITVTRATTQYEPWVGLVLSSRTCHLEGQNSEFGMATSYITFRELHDQRAPISICVASPALAPFADFFSWISWICQSPIFRFPAAATLAKSKFLFFWCSLTDTNEAVEQAPPPEPAAPLPPLRLPGIRRAPCRLGAGAADRSARSAQRE